VRHSIERQVHSQPAFRWNVSHETKNQSEQIWKIELRQNSCRHHQLPFLCCVTGARKMFPGLCYCLHLYFDGDNTAPSLSALVCSSSSFRLNRPVIKHLQQSKQRLLLCT